MNIFYSLRFYYEALGWDLQTGVTTEGWLSFPHLPDTLQELTYTSHPQQKREVHERNCRMIVFATARDKGCNNQKFQMNWRKGNERQQNYLSIRT
jgi:hypothetical protein